MSFAPTSLLVSAAALSMAGCHRSPPTPDAGTSATSADAALSDAASDAADAAASTYVHTWPAKYPDAVHLLGVDQGTGTVFLVKRHGERRGPETLVAVDLKTRQARTVAELRQIPRATQVETLRDDGRVKSDALDGGAALAALSTPELQDELAALIGVLQRIGTLGNDRIATSADGKQVLFNAGDWMYRSFDGGRDLARIDLRASYEPSVSPDGTNAAYSVLDAKTHKYGLQLLAMKPKAAPQGLGRAGDELRPRAWSRDGRSLFGLQSVGSEDSGVDCAVRVDLTGPPRAVRLKCTSPKTDHAALFLIAPGGTMAALVGGHDEGDKGAIEVEWLTLPGGASAGRTTIPGVIAPFTCAITDAGRIACPCLLDNPKGSGGRDAGLVVIDPKGAKSRTAPTASVLSVAWLDAHRLAATWVSAGGVLDVIDADTL